MTLQNSDLQVISAIIDERLTGVEQTLISRLEDTEEFFSTRFDEGEARFNFIGLFKELEQLEFHMKSVEDKLDRLCHCSGSNMASH